jgi:phytoene dehydrogenase-like protein
MTDKSIMITGAGIAGLSAGCYAQMDGYRTQIFELHNIPGGLCTAWKRQGYVCDGCGHDLAGATLNSKLYGLWEELPVGMEDPADLARWVTRFPDIKAARVVENLVYLVALVLGGKVYSLSRASR